MCGIFGIVSATAQAPAHLATLAHHAEQRGRDLSGLVVARDSGYDVERADFAIRKLLKTLTVGPTRLVMGHSRLITNGLGDNQPVVRDGIIVIHNGIVVNYDDIWPTLSKTRELQVDSEVIAAIAADHLDNGGAVEEIGAKVLEACRGTVSCALAVPRLGKLLLFSNNGSLYTGQKNGATVFASESFALNQIGCTGVGQVYDTLTLDIPVHETIEVKDRKSRARNLIPALILKSAEENLLVYPHVN